MLVSYRFVYVAFFLIVLFYLSAYSQSLPDIESAGNLSGELIKNHSYHFDEKNLNDLNLINRQLRPLMKQYREAGSSEVRDSINRQAAEFITGLFDILEKCPFFIDIVLDNNHAKLVYESPVSFPGDEGALLFRIKTGDRETQCNTETLDYSQFPENLFLNLHTTPDGISWILVSVLNAPANEVTIPIKIHCQGNNPVITSIQIKTPPFARLKVNLLSADTGKPVSAMMRMVWKTNGQDRRPSNAIEIAPQMDRQGSYSGRRNARLPGKLGGPYWCVPKGFDMQIPPGEWEIIVRRGVEHIPLFDSFTVKPGEVIEKTYQPRRWVDMRKHGWYSGDEHVHCQILSDADAHRLMSWVQAEDIHLANIVKMGDLYRTWFEQRGWGKDYRVIQDDYVLSPGQECPRTHQELGHTVHMNTKSMIRDTEKYFLYDRVFQKVHQQGGLSGFCHVLFNMFEVHRGMALYLPLCPVDYIEIMQFNQMNTDLYYDFLNLGFKLTAAAGSDVPWGGTVGEVRMYAFLGEEPFTPDEWFEAVRRGRTFVSNGPMIDFTVNSMHPGDEIVIGEKSTLQVHAKVWGHPDRFVPASLQIVSHGEVIREIESKDLQNNALTLDFDLPAEYGCWIAARATGSDGSNAHTTPVYVSRPPNRFWKLEKTSELIQDRMNSLKEIEDLIDDYSRQIKSGDGDTILVKQQFVNQSSPLLERISRARNFYDDLIELARKERLMRKN